MIVVPAKAGTHLLTFHLGRWCEMDSRLRGNDEGEMKGLWRPFLDFARNERSSESRREEVLALLVQPQDDFPRNRAQREVAIKMREQRAAA